MNRCREMNNTAKKSPSLLQRRAAPHNTARVSTDRQVAATDRRETAVQVARVTGSLWAVAGRQRVFLVMAADALRHCLVRHNTHVVQST